MFRLVDFGVQNTVVLRTIYFFNSTYYVDPKYSTILYIIVRSAILVPKQSKSSSFWQLENKFPASSMETFSWVTSNPLLERRFNHRYLYCEMSSLDRKTKGQLGAPVLPLAINYASRLNLIWYCQQKLYWAHSTKLNHNHPDVLSNR